MRKLITLALPIVIGEIFIVGSSFLCMLMLAKLGHNILAASALIFSIQLAVMIVGMSFLISLSVLIGHAYSEGNYSFVGQYLRQGWVLAILISFPIIIFFSNITSILISFGQSKILAEVSQQFFFAHNWRVAPFFLALCNQQLCYGVYKPKIDIVINLIGVVVLLISAYLLIFGIYKLPGLGVAGLGYAMAIQAGFYFISTTLVFYLNDYFDKFILFNNWSRVGLSQFGKLYKVSWPVSIQLSVEMLFFFFIAQMVGWLGVNDLAAYQIVTQYFLLIMVPVFALSQASGILVGQAYGSKNNSDIVKIGSSSLLLTIFFAFIMGLILLLFPRLLTSIYIDVNNIANAQTVRLTTLLFFITAFSQMFDSVRNVLSGNLRGIFDTKFPMIVSLVVLLGIGLPLSYLLGFTYNMGLLGIAIGSLSGFSIGAIAMFFRWIIILHHYNKTLFHEKI